MATHVLPATFDFDRADARAAGLNPGFFRRFLNAMMVARQRQAEREIARYVETLGGKFTDSVEREISRRFQ